MAFHKILKHNPYTKPLYLTDRQNIKTNAISNIMDDSTSKHPAHYDDILQDTLALGFEQLSDSKTGSLVATLCRSKPNGRFIELGTGTGLGTSWMLGGMCPKSTLTSIDNNANLIRIAQQHLSIDSRLTLELADAKVVIDRLASQSIDLIFADTWPGKYYHLDQTLALLKTGGIYIIDDMKQQMSWPQSHAIKAADLITDLESRDNLIVSQIDWSTGLLICVKK